MDKDTIDKILYDTERSYDLISEKFSQTRKHFWRELEFVKDLAKGGDRILDYGCGNGRLLELFQDRQIKYCGVDVSQKLINIAQKKYFGENVCFRKINPGQISLPFSDDYFNVIYSIAVFHHLPDKNFRLNVAKEFYRILCPGGYVVITVWNLWQKKYRKNVFKNWKNKIFGKSEFDWNDCLIDFSDNGNKKIKRFHHAFTERELRQLFKKAGFEIERCEIVNGKNVLLIAKKSDEFSFQPTTEASKEFA